MHCGSRSTPGQPPVARMRTQVKTPRCPFSSVSINQNGECEDGSWQLSPSLGRVHGFLNGTRATMWHTWLVWLRTVNGYHRLIGDKLANTGFFVPDGSAPFSALPMLGDGVTLTSHVDLKCPVRYADTWTVRRRVPHGIRSSGQQLNTSIPPGVRGPNDRRSDRLISVDYCCFTEVSRGARIVSKVSAPCDRAARSNVHRLRP